MRPSTSVVSTPSPSASSASQAVAWPCRALLDPGERAHLDRRDQQRRTAFVGDAREAELEPRRDATAAAQLGLEALRRRQSLAVAPQVLVHQLGEIRMHQLGQRTADQLGGSRRRRTARRTGRWRAGCRRDPRRRPRASPRRGAGRRTRARHGVDASCCSRASSWSARPASSAALPSPACGARRSPRSPVCCDGGEAFAELAHLAHFAGAPRPAARRAASASTPRATRATITMSLSGPTMSPGPAAPARRHFPLRIVVFAADVARA